MNVFFTMLNQGSGSGGSPSVPTPKSTRARVLVSMGQSNCAGYSAFVSAASTQYQSINNNVEVWNGESDPVAFEPINPGVNTDYPRELQGYLPAYIPAMYKMNQFWGNNYPDYVIHFAWGGMDIDNWLEGGSFYNTVHTYVSQALAAISSSSDDYSVVFYWDQGENDANQTLEVAQAYESKFNQMITDYRTIWNVRKLPVVLRKLAVIQQQTFIRVPEIRTQQENILANIADCDLITSDDCEFESSNVHLTAKGQEKVADKLFNKLIWLWD